MAETADVVVVGAGIMGCSIALALAQAGAGRVIVLEQRHVAAGASSKSGAMIGSHFGLELKVRMALESMRTWLNFDDAIGGKDVYHRCGRVWAVGEADAASLATICRVQQREGSTARLLSPQDLRELVPTSSVEGIAAAVYEPDAGYADPVAATYAYAAAARRAGVEIREGAGVQRLLIEGGRLQAVEGAWGRLPAGKVVLANNAWIAKLLRASGLDVPVAPQRAEISLFRRPPGFAPVHPAYADFLQGLYFRPDAGEVTFVGSMEPAIARPVDDPDDYDEGATRAIVEARRQRLRHRFPALASATFRGGYAGLYDTSPDFYPILDCVGDVANLYCAAGFSGDGFKYAPVIGPWLAALALHGQPPANHTFRLSRFADHAPIHADHPFGSSGWFR